MSIENFLLIILASLPGTLLMTATMYLYSYFFSYNTKVIHVFGDMLTGGINSTENHKRKRLLVGTIGHFSVGFLFSLMYFLLWNWGLFEIRVLDTFILGAISGIIAIAVWYFYLQMHSNPPRLSVKHYFIALFIAHIVFAGATVYPFHLLQPSPDFYFELAE